MQDNMKTIYWEERPEELRYAWEEEYTKMQEPEKRPISWEERITSLPESEWTTGAESQRAIT